MKIENSDSSWHNYSSIKALGHVQTKDIFEGEVLIEEKVDGSQFSFGVFSGEIRVRSKGRVFEVHAPDSLFAPVCATVIRLAEAGMLQDGWTYRGETLSKPRHNALTYDRVPEGNIILFDIETCECGFLSRSEKEAEAKRLGLEVVPVFFQGEIHTQDQLNELKGTLSILGGAKIEGFVVKAYDKFSRDKKVLMGKWVSEAFKEVHRKNWKQDHPTKTDIVKQIIETYKTKARWQKAVQHLREDGKLGQEPQDIPFVIREIQEDILKECEQEIKDALFKIAWKEICRGVVKGVPEWYKQQLMEGLFDA